MNKSMVVDIFVADGVKQPIINSIRLYRAACRKAYSMCAVAEMAGAELLITDEDIKIKPINEATKTVLENTFGIYGKKAHLYEMREWIRSLNPSWLSIVPESIHRDVSSRWRAPDVEFPKAKRGYLTLNGKRAFASFMNIGITIKNTVSKLEGHSFFCKWDEEIGKVEFRLGKLDASRHYVWSAIRDQRDGWKLGTIYLKEREGNLKAVISYTAPDRPKKLDLGKQMVVEFSTDPQNFILAYTDDRFSGSVIPAYGAISWLHEMECIYNKYMQQLSSYDKRLTKKHRFKIHSRISKYTRRRENGVKDLNHIWTRRIVQFAQQKNSGNLVVIDVPEKTLADYPWGWHQFKTFLIYKVEEIGGKVTFTESEKKEIA